MDNETSEITKLTERVTRDPKSKLFVPLAEEYKKMGDIEMSIHVLTEGLKNNPGYVTAKSFLGRLLMEKGDLAGAGKEFEEVVKAIPDNLLAQRKLGDIYALQGSSAQALLHYKVAHSLNPADEEISSFISDLEAGRTITERIPRPKPGSAAEAAKGEPGAAPHASAGAGGHAPARYAGWHRIERGRAASRARVAAPGRSGGQALASLGAPRGHHPAAGLRLHARSESVLLGAVPFLGLERLFRHGSSAGS